MSFKVGFYNDDHFKNARFNFNSNFNLNSNQWKEIEQNQQLQETRQKIKFFNNFSLNKFSHKYSFHSKYDEFKIPKQIQSELIPFESNWSFFQTENNVDEINNNYFSKKMVVKMMVRSNQPFENKQQSLFDGNSNGKLIQEILFTENPNIEQFSMKSTTMFELKTMPSIEPFTLTEEISFQNLPIKKRIQK